MSHGKATTTQPVVVPFGKVLHALLARRRVPVAQAAAQLGVSSRTLGLVLRDNLPPDRVAPSLLREFLAVASISEAEGAALVASYEAPRAPRPSYLYRRR